MGRGDIQATGLNPYVQYISLVRSYNQTYLIFPLSSNLKLYVIAY
jgi:hypothetical protein